MKPPSQLEIAEALQIDPALVTRYKARGMPVDSIDAARSWKESNVRARVGRYQQAAPPPPEQPALPLPPEPPPSGNKKEDDPYWTFRTQREAAESAIAELKRGELAGALIRVDAVSTAWANAYATLREAILNVPPRLAPQLAAESDPAVIQNQLHAELHKAITALAKAPARLMEVVEETEGTIP